MSIFKRNNELRNITCKKQFISSIIKGAGINYIGTNHYDGMGFIGDMVAEYIENEYECNLIILSSLTPTQMCFKISNILKDYNYEVSTREIHMTIKFNDSQHCIHIQHYPTYGLDSGIFKVNFKIILHITNFKNLELDLIRKIHEELTEANLSIVAAYPSTEDMSLRTFLKIRKYIYNMGFILYDEEDGDTCFIDILNYKYVVRVIREKRYND